MYRREAKSGGWTSWYAVIDVERSEDGRRHQKSKAFGTRAEAYAWLAGMAQPTDDGPSLADWLGQWLGSRLGDLRASTRASYRGHAYKYLVPLLGDTPLGQVGVHEVEALHAMLSAAGVSTELARRIHATLSSALSDAVRDDLIGVNPCTRVRVPRGGRYQPVVWSAEQAAHFLACTANDPLCALWRLALLLGLRRGELLGLRWSDINSAAATLTVHTTRVAVGAQVVEGPPKSARGRRVLPLDPATAGMLAAHRHRQIEQTPHTWSLGQHVFTDQHGAPLAPRAVSRRFGDLVDQAGLPRIRFHDLRHTSATLGLAAGESLKEVSQRLGHSSIVVTADTYLSPPDRLARASTERLARTLDHDARRRQEGAA